VFLQFKLISQAYEVLADHDKRKLYDEGGEKAIREGAGRGYMLLKGYVHRGKICR